MEAAQLHFNTPQPDRLGPVIDEMQQPADSFSLVSPPTEYEDLTGQELKELEERLEMLRHTEKPVVWDILTGRYSQIRDTYAAAFESRIQNLKDQQAPYGIRLQEITAAILESCKLMPSELSLSHTLEHLMPDLEEKERRVHQDKFVADFDRFVAVRAELEAAYELYAQYTHHEFEVIKGLTSKFTSDDTPCLKQLRAFANRQRGPLIGPNPAREAERLLRIMIARQKVNPKKMPKVASLKVVQ